jgi:hypothetical protein
MASTFNLVTSLKTNGLGGGVINMDCCMMMGTKAIAISCEVIISQSGAKLLGMTHFCSCCGP